MSDTCQNLTEIETQKGIIRANLKTATYLKSFSKGFSIGAVASAPLYMAINSSDEFPIHSAALILIGVTSYAAASLKAKCLKKELSNLEKQDMKII